MFLCVVISLFFRQCSFLLRGGGLASVHALERQRAFVDLIWQTSLPFILLPSFICDCTCCTYLRLWLLCMFRWRFHTTKYLQNHGFHVWPSQTAQQSTLLCCFFSQCRHFDTIFARYMTCTQHLQQFIAAVSLDLLFGIAWNQVFVAANSRSGQAHAIAIAPKLGYLKFGPPFHHSLYSINQHPYI